VQDGNHGEKHPTSADYVETGIPFVMAKDFHDGHVDLDACKKIPKDLGDSLRVGFARSGDILLTHKGTVGEVAIVPKIDEYLMLTPQVTYYRTNPTKLLNKYLKYAFMSPYFRDQLFSFSAQSTRPYIGITSQKELRIEVHALTEQRRIASILSAYDELIENSQRRIRLLEAIARALYREWFVEFRFPGHEKLPLVASPLGGIPKGWEVKPVESFCPLVIRGVTPKYEAGSGRFIINQKVNRGSELSLDELKELETSLDVPADKFARFGDVLVNCLGEGTIGRVHFYTEPHQGWAVDQHMSICRAASPTDSLYVYFALESPEGQARITSMKTGGTNMTMFNISALRSFDLVEPPPTLRARFAELALPMMRQRQTLSELTRNLRRTRNLLVPKLLSGDVDVSHLVVEPEKLSA